MWKIILVGFLSCGFSGRFARGEEEDIRLGDACESHDDCSDVANAICNSMDVCECADEYLVSPDNTTCLPLALKLGDPCKIPEQCSDLPSAECVDNACVVAQAVAKSPMMTKPAKPGDQCTEDSQCSFLKGVCKNGTCSAVLPSLSPRILSLDNFTIGLPCVNETDCPLEGATCVDKVCRCKEDFVASQNLKMCLSKAKSVGDNCTETAQCVSLNGSICENQKCVDKIGKFLKNVAEKLPTLLIGSTCQDDRECSHLSKAACLENVCQCEEGFVTSVASNACLAKAKKEGDACEIYKQCEDVRGSGCISNKCIRPFVAGTRLGNPNAGSTRTLSELLAAILFIKTFLV